MNDDELMKEKGLWGNLMRNASYSMFSYSNGSEFQAAMYRMQKRLDLIVQVFTNGAYKGTPKN